MEAVNSRSRTVAPWLALAGLAVLATWVVGDWQVGDRSPLVWDEAARMNAAVGLSDQLRAVSISGVLDWISQQTFYPFASSAPSGVALWLGFSPLAAAWLPALLCFGLAGVLVALAVRECGGGWPGMAVGAVVFWTAPIEARLAGGAFTEPLGCVVEAGLLVVLARMRHAPTVRLGVLAGAIVASAFAVKYDYGLLCVATLGIAEFLRISSDRSRASLTVLGAAAGTALVLIAVQFLGNATAKIEGASDFIGASTPGSGPLARYARAFSGGEPNDFTYYARLLFGDAELGLSTLTALLSLASIPVAGWLSRSRPAVRPVLVFLALWWVMYSLAGSKFARLAATLIPVLAILVGVAAGVLIAWAMTSRRRVALGAAGAAVALVAAGAVAQLDSMRKQFFFLTPDPQVQQASRFLAHALQPSKSTLLYIGPSNELSPGAVRLLWRQAGQREGNISTVQETAPQLRAETFAQTLAATAPSQIVIASYAAGSRFDTGEQRDNFASQPIYAGLAVRLRNFRLVQQFRTDDGAITVRVLRAA